MVKGILKYHRNNILYFTLLVFFVITIGLVVAPYSNQAKVEESIVTFTSKAPLETITASSKSLIGILDTAKREFSFKISMGSFNGFNNPLQKVHFEENYLEIDKYPYASFTGKIIEETSFQKDGDYEVRGKGTFTVHGVSLEKTIRCNLNVKNGVYTVTSKFPIKLIDYKILIPHLVNEKIAEEIAVNISIKIK